MHHLALTTDYGRETRKEDGMLLMNWSYGYDWEKQYMDAAASSGYYGEYTTSSRWRQIFLCMTVSGLLTRLKDIVEGLRAKGYELIDPATIKGIE